MIKEILKNIIPSMISTLFTGIYVIVDGFFIGQKVGDLGLAAINVAWPIAAFIQALGIATGTACGIYISYYRSQDNEEKIKTALSNTLLIIILYILICLAMLTFISPLLKIIGANEETMEMATNYIKVYIYASAVEIIGCALIPIMRNFGHYRFAAILLFTATIVNFIGDYLLIFLFNYGLVGAAIASVLSQGAVMITGIIALIK